MAVQLYTPVPQFVDSTGLPRSGSRVFFYVAGTSTKLDTYPTLADAIAGTNANDNPMELNSLGQPANAVFLQDKRYKIVLASAGSDDPPTSPIWTRDNFHPSDFSLFIKSYSVDGDPNGTIAGTAGSSGILPSRAWDYTNNRWYTCTTTGTSSTTVWTAENASAATAVVVAPQGRLTLVSATPVVTSDQQSKTTVYYTPTEQGNLIPIYNGASFTPTEFSELSLDLVSNHAASTIYDVFVWSESGVLTVGTGPAWNTSTAGSGDRGTGASTTELTRVKGLLVNAVDITTRNSTTTYSVEANLATYVGSIFIDSTQGQVSCHVGYGELRKFGVWNAYNRRPILIKGGNNTATHTYTTDTYRAFNNDTDSSITTFTGLAETPIKVQLKSRAQSSNTDIDMSAAIGWNSTSTASGIEASQVSPPSEKKTTLVAEFDATPDTGINVATILQKSVAAGTTTWSGTETNLLLTAEYEG